MGGDETEPNNGKAADFSLVRELNRALILNLIRQEGALSRAAIARRTALSRSTVSSIISELLEGHLIAEVGRGQSSGGRRPILLEYNYKTGFVVGLDLGATHMAVLLTDLSGEPIFRDEVDFDITIGPDYGLPKVAEITRRSLSRAGLELGHVVGLGVGVPGPVDYVRGVPISPPIMPGWHEFPLRDWLSDEMGVPVYMDNDANLGALGERWRGVGRGRSNLAYVKVGTGIGCGLILRGELYRGDIGSAGEIGHLTIDENGPPCKCGSYGCLESMAGGPAIAQRAQQAIRAGQPTSLSAVRPIESITAADVASAARAGDRLALQLFGDAGRHIGVALASLANLLDPGLIIIGGGVAQAGEILLGPIRETVHERVLRSVADTTEIVQSRLGRDTTGFGAVHLALQEVFRSPALVTASRV